MTKLGAHTADGLCRIWGSLGGLQSEEALTLEPAPPEFHLCWGLGQGGQEGIIPNSSGLGAPEAALAG